MSARGTNPPVPLAVWYADCAVLDLGGLPATLIAGCKKIGPETTPIRAYAFAHRVPHAASWRGFSLRFPLPEGQTLNEELGFGVRYNIDRKSEGGVALAQSTVYDLRVRFPRGQTSVTIEPATPAMCQQFPGANNLSMVMVRLNEGSRVSVTSFGMPYKNSEREKIEAWVNQDAPINGNITLSGFLARREFHLLFPVSVASAKFAWDESTFPAPFSYPYGTDHWIEPQTD